MQSRKIAIAGGTGKTGSAVAKYLATQPDMDIRGMISRHHAGKEIQQVLPGFKQDCSIYSTLSQLLAVDEIDVLVDFTTPEVARHHFYECISHNIHPIIGTTGFTASEITELARLCQEAELGAAIIPNFSLGAMATLQAAKQVSHLFNEVSLLETYPPSKKDKPSGTTKKLIAELKKADNFTEQDLDVHSVRLSGVVSHQELTFGGMGESLTISHRVVDRGCFAPGVCQAVRNIARFDHLITELIDLF